MAKIIVTEYKSSVVAYLITGLVVGLICVSVFAYPDPDYASVFLSLTIPLAAFGIYGAASTLYSSECSNCGTSLTEFYSDPSEKPPFRCPACGSQFTEPVQVIGESERNSAAGHVRKRYGRNGSFALAITFMFLFVLLMVL